MSREKLEWYIASGILEMLRERERESFDEKYLNHSIIF